MSIETRFLRLTPTDTLFFRDGRPYNQDDDGLAHARSLFPPHPSTVTGAVRAALALGNGWNGRGGWNAGLVTLLGDGPDMEGGKIGFGPLLLLRECGTAWQPLYPAPLSLIAEAAAPPLGWGNFALRRPGPPVDCDLGPGVRLPMGESGCDSRKAVTDLWLTPAGLALVLAGQAGELDPTRQGTDRHLFHSRELWATEPRVGLERDNTSRTAVRGKLYAPVHVRLRQGVCLGVEVTGPWDRMQPPAPLVSLGGEHRTAHVEMVERPALPAPPATLHPAPGGGECVTLSLVTPARVDAAWLTPNGPLPGGARIVSACLGKPVPIGGWDSRSNNGAARGPRALRGFLPAGSTWFLHAPPGWAASPPMTVIGDEVDARHGFGRFVLGTFIDSAGGTDTAHRGDQS